MSIVFWLIITDLHRMLIENSYARIGMDAEEQYLLNIVDANVGEVYKFVASKCLE